MTALTDATFYLPNTTTTVLTNGTGSVTTSRATTKNVFDNEGKLITVKSGARTLGGARCVQNMFAAPATLATQGVTVTAKTYTVSFYGTGTIAFTGAYAGASLVGTGVGDRVQRTFTATAGTVTCTITGSCTDGQFEDVTGQADQTASEYVDSATDYGGGTTGVKFFATNKDGSAIPDADLLGDHVDSSSKTNTLISCRRLTASDVASTCPWKSTVTGGVEKVTNGTFATDVSGWTAGGGVGASIVWNAGGWMDCDTGTGSNELAKQTITGLTIGETYTVGYDRIASSNIVGIYLTTSGGLMQSGFSSTAATRELTFNATSTSHVLIIAAGGASVTASIDNVTLKKADIQVSNTGTGITGQANSCSLLEFLADGATILQTITADAAAGCSGYWVKWHTEVGTVEFTRDNVTWLDITSELSTDAFYVAKIENTSVINPVIGFRGSNGGKIIVDAGLNHLGTQLCEPIFTTTANVTRNAEVVTYQTASNFSDTAGTILATFRPTHDIWPNGSIVGKASFGLLASASNSGVQAADGTNTVSGAAGTPTGQRRIGARWTGSSLQAFSVNPTLVYTTGTAGSYDGAFNLATIGLNTGVAGYIRDIAIFDSSLSDAAIIDAWDLALTYSLTCDVGAYAYTGLDATFVLARNLPCETGSYAYTGLDMTLNLARNLPCDVGAYIYTGMNASLTIITPAQRLTVDYYAPGIIVDYETQTIEVDA